MYIKKDSFKYKQTNYFVTKSYRDLIQLRKWTKKMKQAEKMTVVLHKIKIFSIRILIYNKRNLSSKN